MKNTEQIKNIIEATSMSRLEKEAVKKSILDLQEHKTKALNKQP